MATLDPLEFPEMSGLEPHIEWRRFVKFDDVPLEVARFDINLAPLEDGNPFVEAKSELKFFEAALCGVPTIASPSGPFKRAINPGITGYLASSQADWAEHLEILISDPALRRKVGDAAHQAVLWHYGPLRRAALMHDLAASVKGGRAAALAFPRISGASLPRSSVPIATHSVSYEWHTKRASRVTVVVPLFDYETYVVETLNSVKRQTLHDIDLVVVDDRSTDNSHAVARAWMQENKQRFNRVALLLHDINQGLGASRNTAINFADTLHIVVLDADNKIRPAFSEKCVAAIEREGAAFAYTQIQMFGDQGGVLGMRDYTPAGFVRGNYIDALAMVSKEAWAHVGGYVTHRMGWQDYDFYCRLAERGLHGAYIGEILADYRVHGSSMLRTSTDKTKNKSELVNWIEEQHPWLSLFEDRAGHHIPAERPAEPLA